MSDLPVFTRVADDEIAAMQQQITALTERVLKQAEEIERRKKAWDDNFWLNNKTITALQARIDELEAAQTWQLMETMPNDVVVDVWVRSSANEFYGRRACDLHKRGDKWFGLNPPDANYAEYAYRWMPLPTQPAAQGEQL